MSTLKVNNIIPYSSPKIVVESNLDIRGTLSATTVTINNVNIVGGISATTLNLENLTVSNTLSATTATIDNLNVIEEISTTTLISEELTVNGISSSSVLVNPNTITKSITIPNDTNALIIGPTVTIDPGEIILGSGSTLTIFDVDDYICTCTGTTGNSGSSGTSGSSGSSGTSGSSGSSGTSGGGGIISVTYSELVSLINSSGLTLGSHYVITDYKTCYDQPDYDYDGNSIQIGNYKEGPIEPLIVFAISSNELSSTAISTVYPKDKIQYDWSWNTTEITNNPALGRITERIDEYNNRTDYDHRNILFKRYKTYFYNLNNELQGKIDIDGVNVIGHGTNFIGDLSSGDVIYVLEQDKYFFITDILSNSAMTITGNTLIYTNSLTYYYAEPQIDGQLVTIPYTHTRMTDPPIDYRSEATLSDFLMDGSISGSTDYFGSGSNYFTNLYPGLFVLVAYNTSINTFTIDGNLGADGGGIVDFNIYTTTGTTGYTAYIKRVYDAGDPTVNQIIIINTDGSGVQYDYSQDTDSGFQKLYYLSTATEIHYLLTSTRNGIELTIESIQELIEKYLTNIDSNSLSNTLSTLNLSYSSITDHITDLYLFNDVEDRPNSEGGEIDDGGADMYDGGNLITTDIVESNYDYRCYEIRNNNIPNDNFFYKEFKTFQYDSEIESDGIATSISNYIGNHSEFFNTNLSYSDFILANNVFDKYSYSNVIGDRSYNNSTYRWFSRNKIGNRFYNNRMYRGFYSNIIGEYCYQNTFSGQIWRNNIGEDFNNNNIGNDLQNNTIRNAFNHNTITENFYKNQIGNGFNNNFIDEYFYGNIIGNAYNENNIYNEFYQNIIGDKFQSNNIDANFYNNDIGVEFENNIIYDSFYRNVIGNDFNNNYISGTFQNNQIGNQYNNNKVSVNFIKNTILNGFNNNYIASDFESNIIGNGFNYNYTNRYFQNNVIGDYFDENYFGFNHGWKNLSNTLNRSFYPFRQSVGYNIGYNVVGPQLVMHDTVNDTYYRIRFLNWQQYGKGGAFTYERVQIDPTTGFDIGGYTLFNRENFREDQIDVIIPGVLEIKRDNYGGGIYNVAVESSFNGNFSPTGTEWNSYFNDENASFQNNKVGNNFYYNEIGDDFKYNTIGDRFENNIVLEGFGFGYNSSQGNVIGNYFYGNLIGEYFYNNRICDGFYTNQVGNYFQNNYIKSPLLNNINFKEYYGNVSAFTYTANGSSVTDNTYTGLLGTTNGNGVNASFDIVVSGNVVTNVTLNASGITYNVNDTITILGTQIGGVDGVDDVVITVTAISQTPSVYEVYTCDIFLNSNNTRRLSYYDSSDVLTIKDITK